ncbi:MAG TPA: ATP synthase subunit I [Nitrospirota bacterium]|nr:ATP synthase subunit I [Nitrospirota bacterium]
MTIDESQIRKQATEAIIKGVTKKTALITSLAVAAVLVFIAIRKTSQPWWSLPAGILFGAVLGVLNFRWLATAVQRVYLRKGATPGFANLAAVTIGLLKLLVIFIVLFVVIKWQLLHVFGLVAGLSLSFLAILWEGVTIMKRALDGGNQ